MCIDITSTTTHRQLLKTMSAPDEDNMVDEEHVVESSTTTNAATTIETRSEDNSVVSFSRSTFFEPTRIWLKNII